MPPTITNATAPPNALPVRGGTTVSPLPGWWAGVALLTCLAMLAWLMERADLNIDPVAPASIVFVLVFAAAGAVLYALRSPATRRQRILRDLTEYYALFTAIALIGAMASYPVAAETRGFVDGGLAYTDALLHFRWLSWYHVVADHRVLQLLGTIAYQSIYVSPAVLLGHFARVGDRMRAYRFITAFWVSAVLALLLFATMPAVGPLAYFVHGPLPYLPDSERYMADLIPALRLHEIHLIDLGAIRGLVSAPSFHTASAILFIATAWPHRMLRWPLTAMNVAMLASTPVEGTHYLTDMIVGAAVAGIGLLAAAQLFQRLARRDQAGSTAISVTP